MLQPPEQADAAVDALGRNIVVERLVVRGDDDRRDIILRGTAEHGEGFVLAA